MNIPRLFIAIATLLSSSLAIADDMKTPEDQLWSTLECGGKKVDLMVNHRTVAQPTLFIAQNDNVQNITFEASSCYTELQCINYQGKPAVHFLETACGGNAFETYWVVDVNTLQKYDLDYNQAKQAGFVNY